MELPFEFCENKNWLFYLIVYMRRTKNQQNKFLVIKFRLAGDWCAAGTYAIQGKPVDQKIILYYYYCMMRMFKSYPELEIAEPTGDLEKMQFSCCLNLSNFFIRLSICLASLVCTCCFRWKMLEDGSRSNLWTMGGQVHYTHYCWPILCKH